MPSIAWGRQGILMATLMVRVTPRSSRDELTRFEEGVLHVRVIAPPAEGAANAAVTRLLASSLGLPTRDVTLVAGVTSRVKRFELPLPEAELTSRIATALASPR